MSDGELKTGERKRMVRRRIEDGEPVVVLERVDAAEVVDDVADVGEVNIEDESVAGDGRSVADAGDEELTALESMVVKIQGKAEVLKGIAGELSEDDEEEAERKRRLRKGLRSMVRMAREGAEMEGASGETRALREAMREVEEAKEAALAEEKKARNIAVVEREKIEDQRARIVELEADVMQLRAERRVVTVEEVGVDDVEGAVGGDVLQIAASDEEIEDVDGGVEEGAGVRSVVVTVDGKRPRDDEVEVGMEQDGGDMRRRRSDEGSDTDWVAYDRRARGVRGPRGRRGGSGSGVFGRWRSDGAMDVDGERYEEARGSEVEPRSSGRMRVPPCQSW